MKTEKEKNMEDGKTSGTFWRGGDAEIWGGEDCLEVMRRMDSDSVDAIVTDPPYGLSSPPPIHEVLTCWLAGEPWKATGRGFMGKEWDSCVPGPEYWREALRVLKPGGHAVIFAGSRTVDLMGMAVRLAGFHIRDQIQYLYGSGFPKSMNISISIDKQSKAMNHRARAHHAYAIGDDFQGKDMLDPGNVERHKPITDAAKEWDGWGTALKPAHEPIILARKPFPGTVAENVQRYGTGALNIDACRIEAGAEDLAKLQAGTAAVIAKGGTRGESWKNTSDLSGANPVPDSGRWPANVIMDEEAGAVLDEQSGERPGNSNKHLSPTGPGEGAIWDNAERTIGGMGRDDTGGASRFFYCAKTSKREKSAGLEHRATLSAGEATGGRKEGSAGLDSPRSGAGRLGGALNPHPTTKPLSLMRHLCRLITPRGGLILDPFNGSGSTGCAAVVEGFRYVGCELSEDFAAVSRDRIKFWQTADLDKWEENDPPPKVDPRQTSLFDLVPLVVNESEEGGQA